MYKCTTYVLSGICNCKMCLYVGLHKNKKNFREVVLINFGTHICMTDRGQIPDRPNSVLLTTVSK